MKNHYLLLPFIFSITLGQVLASVPDNPYLTAANSELSVATTGFEENKGQVLTTDGDPAPFVRFTLSSRNAKIFLLENGIAYQFERMHYPDGYTEMMADKHSAAFEYEELDAMHAQIERETFRMDMLLEGADPQARISTQDRSHDYTNYYNRDVLDVHHYSKITYHDVYPGIDWLIYTTATGMKYDFVVHPGADPDLIRLRFEHHLELYLDDNGNLIHGNLLGRFTEQRPLSFQSDVEVPTSFLLEGNILRFGLGTYDRTKALTIDPDRIWGTYYGGESIDKAHACVIDGESNIYLAGQSLSTTAIASAGHQNTSAGSTDAYLAKFSSPGVLLWATYYGGENSEDGQSCSVDASGNVYLSGNTDSETGISYQGHQNNFGGSQYGDAFLVKFNADGLRLWGTYYGGAQADNGFSCTVDGNDNVFLVGRTTSNSSIASEGHQNTYGGVYYDAFLVKFSSDGLRLWGTYYGSASNDVGMSCAVDVNGNVYLAGETSSPTGISHLGHQNDYGGGYGDVLGGDAFLVKFNGSGVRLWSTYYGGTHDEYGNSCAVDDDGNVYLAGNTESISAIASGGHQNTIGGDIDGFVAKFNENGIRIWCTYYGGTEDDRIECVVARNGSVYLAGRTESSSDIASGGFQNNHAGGNDAFLIKLNSAGVRDWGTYYGGPSESGGFGDFGYACAADGNGHVYLAGTTSSSSSMAYNGHQNSYGGSGQDAYLVQFEAGISTGIVDLQEQLQGFELHLYPNPARNGWFALTLRDPAFNGNTSVMIELFDALGKQVHTERATASGGELNHVLHLDKDLGVGLYNVVVSFGGVRVQRSLAVE